MTIVVGFWIIPTIVTIFGYAICLFLATFAYQDGVDKDLCKAMFFVVGTAVASIAWLLYFIICVIVGAIYLP